MKRTVSVSCCLALLVSGCASSAVDIEATHVSRLQFADHTCEQLMVEAQDLSIRVQQAAAAQDKARRGDNVKMAVGLLVFWPTLLFIKGDGPKATELANLKGEMIALEEASNRKGCGIQFDRGE
jgi:hypothetical protein